MRTDLIDKMIAPHVRFQQLTYDSFDSLFADLLTHKEQYAVCDYLESKGIQLVDEIIADKSDQAISAVDGQDSTGIAEVSSPSHSSPAIDYNVPLTYRKKIYLENEQLCVLIQRGDKQACQDICVKNTPLVAKYVSYFQRAASSLDYDDLMQVGYMGLLKAAQRFDITMGTKFSTYAVSWIKQQICRTIADEDTLIRIPVHMYEHILRVTRCDNALARRGIAPLAKRIPLIADECGLDKAKVIDVLKYRQAFMNLASLDIPIGEDKSTHLGELLSDESQVSVEDEACYEQLQQDLDTILHTLSPREERVIRLRFGIDDGRSRTLEEIGEIFGVTRERIRQIEKKAIRRLRHPSRSRKLRSYTQH